MTKTKDQWVLIQAEETVNGLDSGVGRFIKKNNVNLRPNKGVPMHPREAFFNVLTDDSRPDYPFDESYMKAIGKALEEDGLMARCAVAEDNEKLFRATIRTIVNAETIRFLEAHREPALKLILKLRGEIE
jgi:hypothetical protein